MLDEQTTVLTNLGSGEEATLLRAKMQSRSLLSDMESFQVIFIFIEYEFDSNLMKFYYPSFSSSLLGSKSIRYNRRFCTMVFAT